MNIVTIVVYVRFNDSLPGPEHLPHGDSGSTTILPIQQFTRDCHYCNTNTMASVLNWRALCFLLYKHDNQSVIV